MYKFKFRIEFCDSSRYDHAHGLKHSLINPKLSVVGMWSFMIDVIRPVFQTLRGKMYPSSEMRGEIIFRWSDRKAD